MEQKEDLQTMLPTTEKIGDDWLFWSKTKREKESNTGSNRVKMLPPSKPCSGFGLGAYDVEAMAATAEVAKHQHGRPL